MNSLLGLGFGLPISSPNTSVSKDGGTEGIDNYSAFSATPQSSRSVQPTFYGTKFDDLSASVQAVMLSMQESGGESASALSAGAMGSATAQDSGTHSSVKDNGLSLDSPKDSAGNPLDKPSVEEEFDQAMEEALAPPSKEESKQEKTDIERASIARQQQDEQFEKGLVDADMQASIAGLDSRVSTQVMASNRSVNAMTGSLAA